MGCGGCKGQVKESNKLKERTQESQNIEEPNKNKAESTGQDAEININRVEETEESKGNPEKHHGNQHEKEEFKHHDMDEAKGHHMEESKEFHKLPDDSAGHQIKEIKIFSAEGSKTPQEPNKLHVEFHPSPKEIHPDKPEELQSNTEEKLVIDDLHSNEKPENNEAEVHDIHPPLHEAEVHEIHQSLHEEEVHEIHPPLHEEEAHELHPPLHEEEAKESQDPHKNPEISSEPFDIPADPIPEAESENLAS